MAVSVLCNQAIVPFQKAAHHTACEPSRPGPWCAVSHTPPTKIGSDGRHKTMRTVNKDRSQTISRYSLCGKIAMGLTDLHYVEFSGTHARQHGVAKNAWQLK